MVEVFDGGMETANDSSGGDAVKIENYPMPKRGFTLVEIMVVTATLALLTVILVTNSRIKRDTSRLNVVQRNFREPELTKEPLATQKLQPAIAPAAGVVGQRLDRQDLVLGDFIQPNHSPNLMSTPPLATFPSTSSQLPSSPTATRRSP